MAFKRLRSGLVPALFVVAQLVAPAFAEDASLAFAEDAKLAFAEEAALVVSVKGDVRTRDPKGKTYTAVTQGASIPNGHRVKTGDDGAVSLKFPDGTRTDVRPKSEVVVRPNAMGDEAPNAIVVFFGRVWSKAAKAVGAHESFEVRSANAIAGVRGTEFEVGVGDDGSTRVVVSEGAVAVEGEEEKGTAEVGPGYEVESDANGRLADRKKAPADLNWSGWFAKCARDLEKKGLQVAKDLDGRLNRRKAKVEKLVAEQKTLREAIERLEARKQEGADVDQELRTKLAALERVTERLEDMRGRLQSAFGLFERWGAVARKGGMSGGEEVLKMSDEVAKIAADFADMIEEGTDLSEEGMNDMMEEMKDVKGGAKGSQPKKSARDELF